MNSFTKGREARRNDERLYYKFIVKYFENLHKDLFTEVMNLYKETKKMNPNVRDLTKTAQFMAAVTPDIPVPRYYLHRQLKADTTHQLQRGPRMVLQIPLHKHQPSPSHKPQPSPSVTVRVPSPPVPVPSQPSQPAPVPLPSPPLLIPDNMYQELLAEIRRDPNMQQTLNDFHFNNDDDMNAQPAPLLIPDNTYQEPVAEILRDPNIQQILNDFPFNKDDDDDDDDDDMNAYVWDDVYMPDDISPIETEMDRY